jgi:hypothetical protein
MILHKEYVQKTVHKHEISSGSKDADAECVFCKETFEFTNCERWVTCVSCSKWACKEHAGVDQVIHTNLINDLFSLNSLP